MGSGRGRTLLLSCEHATCRVPAAYRDLFVGKQAVLQSHRGWDPGTLILGRFLQRRLTAPLFVTEVSRLLIEANRSLHHPHLFSEFTQHLDHEQKQRLIQRFYQPYRDQIYAAILAHRNAKRHVLHVSLHSFTDTWQGRPRTADIGLLYHPGRKEERQLCQTWQRQLAEQLPELRIRRNYPYLGKADGLTTWLRRNFLGKEYLGIELEISQRLISSNPPQWRKVQHTLLSTLQELLENG